MAVLKYWALGRYHERFKIYFLSPLRKSFQRFNQHLSMPCRGDDVVLQRGGHL